MRNINILLIIFRYTFVSGLWYVLTRMTLMIFLIRLSKKP
ncbi:hypothetical protein EC970259_A0132 [Escherichia coli 99.0741]|nr:hypothetical protein EC970259_A0132 [Escherichia coli 99.0741]